MSHYLKNLIFGTFDFIIASLALLRTNLALRLKIIWQSYFDAIFEAKIDIINTLQKQKNMPKIV